MGNVTRFDYQTWMLEAQWQVVRRALEEAQRDGFEGNHHFYIVFRTRHPEVQLPPMLRDLYPQTMTIVLQHQWWDLEVGADRFSVTLAFNAQKQRLTIPYAAIESFVDPGAEFGLRIEVPGPALPAGAGDSDSGSEPNREEAGTDNVVSLADFRRRPRLVE